MGNQEICITEFKLEESEGNLRTLQTNWGMVPVISESTIDTSKGKSAECVSSSLGVTTQVSNSFQTLLDNSIRFFEQLGISFKESDEAASKNIDSITQS